MSDLFFILITSVVSALVGGFLGGYASTRGDQEATKQELNGLQRQLEALRSEFDVAVARVAAVHGHRFAVEVEVLKVLWSKLIELRMAGDRTWYEGFISGDAVSGYSMFRKELEKLQNDIDRIRPFIPSSIHEPLLRAQLSIRGMAASLKEEHCENAVTMKAFLDEHQEAIRKNLNGLEDAIRRHLWEDDKNLHGMIEY